MSVSKSPTVSKTVSSGDSYTLISRLSARTRVKDATETPLDVDIHDRPITDDEDNAIGIITPNLTVRLSGRTPT